MGVSNNHSEQRSDIPQQHYTRHHHQHARYHSNFFQTPHYQQTHSPYGGGYAGSVRESAGGEYSRMGTNVGNQRGIYGTFLNYHTEASGSNNLLEYHQMNPQQNQYSQRQSNKNEAQNNITCKKSSHISSSASSSSASSSSSNSSYSSQQKHQHQQTVQQQQHKSSSNLNSAIETLSSKFSNQHLSQRHGHHHRGGHYHAHNYHGHHSHQGHQYHTLPSTPTTPQHQNYYNLTYVSTDTNSINTTTPRNCSPAPEHLVPSPMSTSSHSSKGVENTSGTATTLYSLPQNLNQVNYSRYSNTHNSTSPQFQQYQQQKFLNKKIFVPLTLAASSPSPTPLATQQLPIRPHNIICCSQLDEATKAAAAAAAKTGIIAGNEYDSDTSSTHSTAVVPGGPAHSLKSLSTTHHTQQDCQSQCGTPADVAPPVTHLYNPLDYAYAPTAASQAFPNTKSGSTITQQHQQQQILNHEHIAYNSAPNAAEANLPEVYKNGGVISLLPNQSPNRCGGSSSGFMEDDYYQRQAPPRVYITHHQSTAEHLNALSLTTNCSGTNSSSGYWSPTHQYNVLYQQLPSGTTALIASNTPSCGSSSASVSPCLTEQGDGNPLQHISSSGDSSPSPCLNEQLVGHHFTSSAADSLSVKSSSSNSSASGQVENCSFRTATESNSRSG